MEISLDEEQVLTLFAVEQGRVHNDPRIPRPDWEKLAEFPFGHRPAVARLKPLRKARLVELPDESEADANGVRAWKLTDLGDRIVAEYREQEAAAAAGGGA
ncbi:hypothetical protein ABZ807_05585 [Micromonospora sp. NPDC047548]|uniref:hypothetical protein n=1 Tax=Micromonospora sp. NPDC047548 TaxID=3155624 RepID=UPI0033F9CE58